MLCGSLEKHLSRIVKGENRKARHGGGPSRLLKASLIEVPDKRKAAHQEWGGKRRRSGDSKRFQLSEGITDGPLPN